MNTPTIRDGVEAHLTQWFRGLGVETHQIENSARELETIIEQICMEVIGEDEPSSPNLEPNTELDVLTMASLNSAIKVLRFDYASASARNGLKDAQRQRLKTLMGDKS